MKWPYKLSLGLLIVLCVCLEIWLYKNSEKEKRVERMIPAAALFVAIGSSIIALSNSDKKPKVIKAEIAAKIISGESRAEYKISGLPEHIQKQLNTSKEIIYSYQVTFSIKNTSSFSLKKPTITFRLPLSLKHPEKTPVERQWYLNFNSNLFNSQEELRILEFQNTQIISNSNLPYLNKEEEVNFWIRMCLDNESNKVYEIIVSINAENAEGISKTIHLNPKELLSSTQP